MAPPRLRTQSEEEILQLQLTTDFPDLRVTEEVAASVAACYAKRCDWWVAVKVVTYRRGMGNKFFCPTYKSRDGQYIPDPVATGKGDYPSLPGQDFSCLPGFGLCSCHLVLG